MSRNSNQLSVAELLARNGQQPASGSGGRRRRGGGGVPLSELSGELPAVDGVAAHATPDDEEPDGAPAHYAPEGYSGEQFPGDPNHSPMSGPITVYNPLDPQQSEPTGPDQPFPPEVAAPGRSGRRRRADPDDDPPVDGFAGADPVQQPWETGPPAPGGGRAARRRAAEALEAAAAEESEAPPEYGPPPEGRFGPPPAPLSPAPQGFGRPDTGPPRSSQGPNGGPPRLGPPAPVADVRPSPGPAAPARPANGLVAPVSPPPGPAADTWNASAPATEAWQGPPPAEDSRPKLERRRRGTRPLPDPAPWPPAPANLGPPAAPGDTGAAANAEQATTSWPLANRSKNLRPAPPGMGAPVPVEPDRSGWHRNGSPPPGAGSASGFADFDRQPPDHGGPGEFGAADNYATDIYEPLPPLPGPMPRESQPETGDFEPDFGPDSDIYPELEAPASESRADRARAALTTKFGAVSGKLAGVRARPDRARNSDRDDDRGADPRRQWLILGGQSVGAAVAGMLMFKGFEKLWERQPLAALALAVVVILGLVALVRILRRTDDIYSIVIAVVVGVFVTLGPLAFLLSAG